MYTFSTPHATNGIVRTDEALLINAREERSYARVAHTHTGNKRKDRWKGVSKYARWFTSFDTIVDWERLV